MGPSVKCYTHCLNWENHLFIENTIPAIKAAFDSGAQRVEIDLQMSRDGEVVVIHNNDLFCQTGHHLKVSDLVVKELKMLDISANYKFINRSDNPLKGHGIGLLPTLREVLNAFPGKAFLLNPKRDDEIFLNRLNSLLREFDQKKHDLRKFSMWGSTLTWKSLKSEFSHFGERFSSPGIGVKCENEYQAYAWTGFFPESCKNINLALSVMRINEWNLWGWPLGMVNEFRKNGSKIYLLHIEDYDVIRRFYTLGLDGAIVPKMSIFHDQR